MMMMMMRSRRRRRTTSLSRRRSLHPEEALGGAGDLEGGGDGSQRLTGFCLLTFILRGESASPRRTRLKPRRRDVLGPIHKLTDAASCAGYQLVSGSSVHTCIMHFHCHASQCLYHQICVVLILYCAQFTVYNIYYTL